MFAQLITITLDEEDQTVLAFTHDPSSTSIEQKLLGALLRRVNKNGFLQIKLISTYGESDDKPLYDYHIREPRLDPVDEIPAKADVN